MDKKLKSCPFCSSSAVFELTKVRKGYEAVIHCDNCLANIYTITYDTENEALDAVISAWNERVMVE